MWRNNVKKTTHTNNTNGIAYRFKSSLQAVENKRKSEEQRAWVGKHRVPFADWLLSCVWMTLIARSLNDIKLMMYLRSTVCTTLMFITAAAAAALRKQLILRHIHERPDIDGLYHCHFYYIATTSKNKCNKTRKNCVAQIEKKECTTQRVHGDK